MLILIQFAFAQVEKAKLFTVVSDSVMNKIYEEIKTPFKYGLVLVPDSNVRKYDSPSVFKKGNQWYMTYIVFDGKGYETWLAKSKDLLNWNSLGKLLFFNNDSTIWDATQKAGYTSLQNTNWGGDYSLEKYNNKSWMSYIGGNVKGYEAGALSLGIAYTKNDPTKPHEWNVLPKPVFTPGDHDVRWWENKKIYKSSIIQDKDKITGFPFLIYYNAVGDSLNGKQNTKNVERIGMAVSNDMVHWQRFGNDPVLQHSQGITGDPVFQKIKAVWVMFYFGAFWEGRNDAFNRFACSYDLVNWTDWKGADLIQSSEKYDEKYAHKSFVVKWKGVVYHFYNAVNNKEQRGIAVATSVDLGKSTVSFSDE